MNSKSDEEKIRINRLRALGAITASKNNKSVMISKPEKELVELLTGDCDVESQFILNADSNLYLYDIRINNKIIEYNGDYWHCNPSKWLPEQYNKSTKCTAKEKWKSDKRKLDYAISKGYDVLVIWESEWKNDKENIIEKCKRFIDGN
jgi:hypothetical protein